MGYLKSALEGCAVVHVQEPLFRALMIMKVEAACKKAKNVKERFDVV